MTPLAIVPSPAARPSLVEIFGDGEPIRLDISHDVYHADRSCDSSTTIRQMLRSAKAYRYYRDYGRKETDAMFEGTAIHKAVLEPEEFEKRYLVAPVPRKQRNAYAAFKAAHADKLILTQDQLDMCRRIVESVAQHPGASTLLACGHKEATLIWQDKETGLWLKIRPDNLCLEFDTGICLDLKSTEDCRAEPFFWSCRRYDYDVSAALYLDGLRTILQRDFDYAFLAVEKQPAHDVGLWAAPEEMIAQGRRRYRQALRQIAECRRTGQWPGIQAHGGFDILPWRPTFATAP